MTNLTKTAVILAAGKGSRLMPLTEDIPKCLLTVDDRTILENALNILSEQRIERVRVVVGYLSGKIMKNIGSSYNGIKIEYAYNNIFEKTNSMYSLYLGLERINEPVWIIEGDIFISGDIFVRNLDNDFSWFVDSKQKQLSGAYLSKDINDWALDLKIFDNNGTDDKNFFKSVGIMHLSTEGVMKLRGWLEEGIKMNKTSLYYDHIISGHFKDTKINLFDVNGAKWFEIDSEEDLKNARRLFSSKRIL